MRILRSRKDNSYTEFVKKKEEKERWAILINEFGEIGVDSSLIQANRSSDNTVFIKEMPGGCMCCTNGLPMQLALNQLISRSRPDRLLIEPTGVGHPKEVLEILSSNHYSEVIQLQSTVVMVDARLLSQDRYQKSSIFLDQIECADVVIGNKSDLYQLTDRERLIEYVNKVCESRVAVLFSERGEFDSGLLEHPSNFSSVLQMNDASENFSLRNFQELDIPDIGYIIARNSTRDFSSIGFRFDTKYVFDYYLLTQLAHSLDVDRFKGIVRTNAGFKILNFANGVLTGVSVNDYCESRIEIVGVAVPSDFETQLFYTLVPD